MAVTGDTTEVSSGGVSRAWDGACVNVSAGRGCGGLDSRAVPDVEVSQQLHYQVSFGLRGMFLYSKKDLGKTYQVEKQDEIE